MQDAPTPPPTQMQGAGCKSPPAHPQASTLVLGWWAALYPEPWILYPVGRAGRQPASIPPSTGMTVPVIHEEASESRKAIIAATSSG